MPTFYEWCLETVLFGDGEEQDIVDLDFSDDVARFAFGLPAAPDADAITTTEDGEPAFYRLCLNRRVYSKFDEGLIDVFYAYLEDGEFPTEFVDSGGNPTGMKVPVKYRKELEKFWASRKG
ncbi:hypothetical protein UFOVP605_40 [uncultured Caudovirales phage]|uniref:Uncharacterized protein n=1 Tax=uncultured Caudovirales phage TaxID=2100421 RepID=A0A6J5N302_9CAUD|nr:hypothetical protein UFOVP605_40 [uncultured Caudovirales phage]